MTDLRAKSDALLKRCRYERGNLGADGRYWWRAPDGQVVRWNPYANAQDAIDLAEAMGLHVDSVVELDDEYVCSMKGLDPATGTPTIAEAICAAIEAALGDPA